MESKPFLDTLPPIPDHKAIEVLLEVIESQFGEQHRDFLANPRPDHLLVKLVILLAWVRGQAPERADRVCTL